MAIIRPIHALLLLVLAGCVAAADTAGAVFGEQTVDEGKHLIAQTGVLGGFLIITGLMFNFLGHRLFRPTLFLAGFYFFGVLGYMLMINIEPATGYGTNRDTILLVSALVFGVLGGGLAICFWKLALGLLGALGGFALGLFILSWKTGGLLDSGAPRTAFLIVMSIFGVVIIYFFQKAVIIVATSVLGSYGVLLGADVFIGTGFADSANAFLSSASKPSFGNFTATPKVYGMLAGMVALAIVGMLVQWKINIGRAFIPTKSKGKEFA
ncbi:hypothetical protein HDV00_006257 [Rhizophlyctis rosea]|nr:hypothetical protein HDV00_006257 [Rhizophlyctis rosea]